MSADYTMNVSQSVDRNPAFQHHFAIVGTVAESESRPSPADEITYIDTMAWSPSATRDDVIRMVSRYVRLEFSIRSGAARLVIDESRTKKRTKFSLSDLEDLSAAETLDAIRTGLIRRAVWARPSDPKFDLQPYADGTRPHRVAPLRDVAQIVRPKSKMGGGTPRMDARLWRATVAQKLHRLPRHADCLKANEDLKLTEPQSLLEAESIRLELQEIRNQLTAARRTARRLRSSGKCPKNERRHAETREGELRSKESMLADRLRRIVRTRAYRCGIDNLLAICTASEEIEAYCFGSE